MGEMVGWSYQSPLASTFRQVTARKYLQSVSVDEPGVPQFCSWNVPLAAQAFHRIRVDTQPFRCLQYRKIVLQRHLYHPVKLAGIIIAPYTFCQEG